MKRYYRVVREKCVFRPDATGHISVILEGYATAAFLYLVALTSVTMLEMDPETDKLYSKLTLS